ncbi:NepR family anti-sigma factor [Sphingomonas sp.]|uniref:NepR family anti-sigma factor n=1 Tax=Sphingomonas sp. TaxID=28214 RepID=UPI001B057AC2|nr:NepR family anti-sigma factor [Sphingomonas sp.]MBO9714312.1 hypothetical protein [Sphingomonas sp.]
MVRSAKKTVKKQDSTAQGGTNGRKGGGSVGAALREAYDETLGESIPDEMLELLKKLG